METHIFVGDDVMMVNPSASMYDELNVRGCDHLFVTDISDKRVEELADCIRYLERKGVANFKICVYYPDELIVKKLFDVGVTQDQYTHYINLWDSIYSDGSQKETEYYFKREKEHYVIELSKKNEFYHTFG